MKEIPVDNNLIALDGMIISEKHDIMIMLCDKRYGNEVLQYIRIYNLNTYE